MIAAAWCGSEGRARDSSDSRCCCWSKRMIRAGPGEVMGCDWSVITQVWAWVNVVMDIKASGSTTLSGMRMRAWRVGMVLYLRWAQVHGTRNSGYVQ